MQKRGLTLEEAAEYCGISASSYRNWMNDKRVPTFWTGTRRIDRLALDAALDKMNVRDELTARSSKFESWKASNASTQT